MTIPTHRLAAIIFTDISGYTSMMGEDESMAMGILKLNREIHHKYFKRFNCTYHKQMGDGFMAVFNSLSEAIYASAHIIEETQKSDINIRIGIHEGDVIFQDNDVYGDGINIAARLEQTCKPGAIYVSESVKRNLDNKTGVSSTFIKEAALKNVKESLRIYEIKVAGEFLPKSLPRGDESQKTKSIAIWKILALIAVLIGIFYYVFNIEYIQESLFSSKSNIEVQLPGNSIAVIPFENLGNNSEFDYLGNGIADGILTKLSMLNDFSITCRTSSFKFKNSDLTLTDFAEQLGVSMILEGSYQVFNDEIKINAKLVGIEENRNLLAKTYSGKLNNIFKLQDQASEGLFRLLGKTEVVPSIQQSSLKYPPSMGAYKFYQEGLNLIRQDYVPKSAIKESRLLFQSALKEDPSYIDPLIALAETFFLEMFYGYNSIYYVKDSIEKYISRATELKPDNGQLVTIRGAIKYYEYNLKDAKVLINRGIELNPNYPFNYYLNSFLSYSTVDRETQLKHINKAISLDPLNSQFQTTKIIQSIFFSEYETAEFLIDASLQKQPGNNMALFLKGMMLSQQNKYRDALEVLLMRSVGDTTNFLVAYSHGMVGNSDKAKKIISILIEREQRYYVSPTMIAVAYLGLDNRKKVLEWMEKAYLEQDPFIWWMLMSIFEPLHQEEQFLDLLKKTNNYYPYQVLYKKAD